MVKKPSQTALFAARLPSHSLRMSVTRNVAANRTLPSVCSMPKALTIMSASMLARTMATAENTYRPDLPNRRYASSAAPNMKTTEPMSSSSFMTRLSLQ